ncbi:hypothetical protein GCM10008959_40920 [Deinococcus seoulensis]|uniref:Primase C-terminal 1 domain-containing protein n=1 Tax=Deinococcus seoulensis TaxID=1837379 RepID=A0ABQ2RWV9_9DEIO|nr:replication initiation protein [Deinococcus seoulensis]GGR75756.1 hypothetical protein GCM10008959_40920 [Deinococcus seoulensis]
MPAPRALQDVLTAITANAPAWPLCGATVHQAGAGFRLPTDQAVQQTYWQPNARGKIHALVADCDAVDPITRVLQGHAPAPNAVVWNMNNDHGHALYLLSEPVGRGGRSSARAVEYAEAVWDSIDQALQADLHYTRLLSRGPLAPGHLLEIVRPELYDLHELARALRLPQRTQQPSRAQRQAASAADSRNRALFDSVRQLAYAHAHLTDLARYALLERHAQTFNQALAQEHPRGALSASELRSVVGSVNRWTGRNQGSLRPRLAGAVDRSRQHSRERQSAAPAAVQRARQADAGRMTAERRAEQTRQALRAGVAQLQSQGAPVTAAALVAVTRLPIRTVYDHSDVWNV